MVDVCLVVEGSYPYVTGGVSVWADRLLRGLPDVRFTVAHVRDAGDPDLTRVFALPSNADLVHVGMDPDEPSPPAGTHRALPEARVYHAACTGAAGELARLAAREHGAAFALTEHGVAWREARWGISGCKHGFVDIRGCKHGRHAAPRTVAEQRRRADAILAMAMRAYTSADAVTSVCGPNALAQRALGASAERLRVVPNPVATGPASLPHDGLLFGFVGRVVAVKDLETFLRACELVARVRDDARFVVVGPTHHEPDYARAMTELAAELELAERVTFTGETDPRPWYARMDALVLTSLSEAQPLVALEAMAAGVPVVATDVGGCRETIGGAGLLTRPGDAAATAAALLRLSGDELLRARLGAAGRALTTARHDPARVLGTYHELYERLAA